MRCIYKNEEYTDDKFDLEHIFPAKLGGKLCDSSLFRTRRASRKANNNLGMFVDKKFIGNYFSQIDYHEAHRAFIDLDEPKNSPLLFMGHLDIKELFPDKTCELWIGFAGEQVYRLRNNDGTEWETVNTGNPRNRKKDRGILFHVNTTAEQRWIRQTFHSIKATFRFLPKMYSINVHGEQINSSPAPGFFEDLTPEAIQLFNTIKNHVTNDHKKSLQNQIAIDINDYYRFIPKMAIGFGHNLFGDEFLDTAYYQQLNKALWFNAENDEDTPEVRGNVSDLSTNGDIISKLLNIDGTYTFIFFPTNIGYSFNLITPGKRSYSIAITNNMELYEKISDTRFLSPQVFVLAPGADFFYGPIKMEKYIAYLEGNYSIQPLLDLESIRTDFSKILEERKKHDLEFEPNLKP